MLKKYLLGIDVGTTTIKTVLVNPETFQIDHSVSTRHAHVSTVASTTGNHEQNVTAIFATLGKSLQELIQKRKEIQVASISVCGQMHGIVWWNKQKLLDTLTSEIQAEPFSTNLITWQDQRIQDTTRLPSGWHSGYGLATFTHILQHQPNFFQGADTCGTIMDLVVGAFIITSETLSSSCYIDPTNAASWGDNCMDHTELNWNHDLLDRYNIPVDMLPQIKPTGSYVGLLSRHASGFFNLPYHGATPVYVGMGDHAASLLGLIQVHISPKLCRNPSMIQLASSYAFVNIGTSAQIAFIVPKELCTTIAEESTTIDIRPFIGEYQLAVGASLAGGNMLDEFLTIVASWYSDLCRLAGNSSSQQLQRENLFMQLIELGLKEKQTSLSIVPTFRGERWAPFQKGSISNLELANSSMGNLFAGLCRGIISHLFDIAPNFLYSVDKVTRIIASGNALNHNSLLRYYLQELAPVPVDYISDADAAFGSTIPQLSDREMSF